MSLASLIATGTKVWLDGVAPSDIARNRGWGVTGATSNPTIVADIIEKGHFDGRIGALATQGLDDQAIAWALDDELVKAAQAVFLPVWKDTAGNDGYVSFELDPLIEDETKALSHAARVREYVELGSKWAAGHHNRMIKVPATAAGLESLTDLAAAGVTINVTLMFTERQYCAARDAIWRGAQQRRNGLDDFKSVYSIFVSRIDVYTRSRVPSLSSAAQGLVGIVTAKRVWRGNDAFWRDKGLRLGQEIVFASTGTKDPNEPPDKYVDALAGSDIETNPPATNEAVQQLGKRYARKVHELPTEAVLAEIDEKVDMGILERVLMQEGIAKFAQPQHTLLQRIGDRRAALSAARNLH